MQVTSQNRELILSRYCVGRAYLGGGDLDRFVGGLGGVLLLRLVADVDVGRRRPRARRVRRRRLLHLNLLKTLPIQ